MKKFITLIFTILPLFFFSQKIKKVDSLPTQELLQVAHSWIEAWNGKIDKEKMLDLHHPDLQYYWRGTPMDYNKFDYALEYYIIPSSNYDLILYNPVVTIIDNDAGVVSFNWKDKNETEPPSAISLTVKKTNSKWKIINIHESLVRPMPPNDFESQFNNISKKYQDDYMNARCGELMPLLSEDLIIFENGEKWPYKKVKEFCPHLPVKPVIATERSYKILGDDLVYEFVSQMYKSNSGNTINETQARIWKYNEFNWKIINCDISRYWIQNE